MIATSSLWGEEFDIKVEETDKILAKLKGPKSKTGIDADKIIKSNKIADEDKMEFIKGEVHRILGHFANDTQTIKSREELHQYIDASINNGIIAVDTETNNSLDPLTCKIMGLCIYTPGQKNAYVPVNHVDPVTHKHLSWQVTEKDIFEELSRLGDTKCVFHNGKFDYMVIYYTCGIKLPIWWDTMIFSQLCDENESAGLKYQYRTKIDKNQEKYDIDKLFGNIPYELFDPELFALYAASDAFETFKLYEYQRDLAYQTETITISSKNGELTFENVDFIPTKSGEKYIGDLVIGDKIELSTGQYVEVLDIKNFGSLYTVNVL